tara:strand:- start:126 stop:590 length:465 start_codon:yes stop_codon:yes gene_type:complete
MKKVKVSFDTWIQLLGMLGVLGGLVFVGLEMQQNQRIAIASQVQARNQIQSNFLIAPLEGSIEVVDLLQTPPSQNDTPQQVRLRNQITRHRALTLTNAWQQYSLGLLTDEAWELADRRGRGMWNDCIRRQIARNQFTRSFILYAEKNWQQVDCE